MPCFRIENHDSGMPGAESCCDASLNASGRKFGADFERSGEVVGNGDNRRKIQVIAYRLQASGTAHRVEALLQPVSFCVAAGSWSLSVEVGGPSGGVEALLEAEKVCFIIGQHFLLQL